MSSLLIKNGRVWDGEKFFFADILTENDKIKKIAEKITDNVDYTYNAEGKIVSPGLVDAHIHIRGISSPEFAIHPEMSTFPFGVTAAADASAAYGTREILDFLMLKNVVFVCAGIRDNKADFSSAEDGMCKFCDKVIGIKTFYDKEIADVSDISPLCEIVEFAEKHNLKVMVHSSNSPIPMDELLSVLREGDILTHAFHGGKHNVSEDDFECLKKARNRGIIIDAGMAGCVHTNFKVFKDAIFCGVIPDTISTDITRFSAYKRGGRYGLTMCMSIAKTLGMAEEDIFRAVTVNPAKALDKESLWGRLYEGGCADIAVISYSEEPFDITDAEGNNVSDKMGYRCELTIADGEVVYKR